MIFTLYAAALLLLAAHLWLWRCDRIAPAAVLYALACACPLALAWLGTDFSPSFTMMFLTANLCMYALAEWIALAGRRAGARGGAAAVLHGLLFAAGALCALPSVYIYAVGDDLLSLCVRGAILAGALLAAGAAVVRWKRERRARPFLLARDALAFGAACFALACGLRSTMLLFYGAGLLLAALSLQFEARAEVRAVLFCLGLLCASVFPVAPML